MAQIQVKLANVRMGMIGSIVQSPDGFEVGPDVQTAQGPFEKPQQYYQAVASDRHKSMDLSRNTDLTAETFPPCSGYA